THGKHRAAVNLAWHHHLGGIDDRRRIRVLTRSRGRSPARDRRSCCDCFGPPGTSSTQEGETLILAQLELCVARGRAPRAPTIVRNVVMGAATMIATYVIGRLFRIAAS